MNKYIKLIIGIAIVVGIVILAAQKAAPKPGQSSLTIGVLAPLTGNFAAQGEHLRNGMELAREDILEQKLVADLNLMYEDACLPKDTTAAVQKLVEVNKINLLGGSFCVAGFVPVVPILAQNHLIAFNTAPNPDGVLNQKYVVSTNGSIKDKASQIGEYAHDKLNAKTAAVIYYDTPLGKDYNKYLSTSFEGKGGKVLSSEMTRVDATDFRTELTKIKALNPDVIFVVQLASPLGNLLKEARELGVKSKFFGNSQNEDPTVLKAAGAAAEGFVISSDEPFPKTDAINEFVQRYQKKYGEAPDVLASNAYDALHLQVDAYKACGGETECMLAHLHMTKDYPGVSGSITINADGSAMKPTIFKIVKNGEFVKLDN